RCDRVQRIQRCICCAHKTSFRSVRSKKTARAALQGRGRLLFPRVFVVPVLAFPPCVPRGEVGPTGFMRCVSGAMPVVVVELAGAAVFIVPPVGAPPCTGAASERR